MGSKARIANEILPIVLESRSVDQYYVEPFAGGMNSSGIDFLIFQINVVTGHGRNGFLFEITKKE